MYEEEEDRSAAEMSEEERIALEEATREAEEEDRRKVEEEEKEKGRCDFVHWWLIFARFSSDFRVNFVDVWTGRTDGGLRRIGV